MDRWRRSAVCIIFAPPRLHPPPAGEVVEKSQQSGTCPAQEPEQPETEDTLITYYRIMTFQEATLLISLLPPQPRHGWHTIKGSYMDGMHIDPCAVRTRPKSIAETGETPEGGLPHNEDV